MEQGLQFKQGVVPAREALVGLYASVGWSIYSGDPEGLLKAVTQSSHVTTGWANGALIGLARCVSDDVSIAYIQDILVDPKWQGKGAGRRLLQGCLDRYAHVRQKVLLTELRQDMKLGF